MFNKNKIIFCVILFMISLGLLFFVEDSVYAMTNQKSINSSKKFHVSTVYIRGIDDAVIKRSFVKNGLVTLTHYTGIVSGNKEMCIGESVSLGYDASATFVGSGSSWDTPYVKWVSTIDKNRKSEKYSSSYWLKFYDTGGGGRWGKIAWSAVKPKLWSGSGNKDGKVYFTSDNNNVVSCVGSICTAKKNGTVTITAHFPVVTVRMWTFAHFSKPYPKGSDDWISEHWDHPMAVSTRLAQSGDEHWMFCPAVKSPSNNSINYCTNKLSLPEKTVSWTITVGGASRCEYCGDGKKSATEQCDSSWSGNTYPVNDCNAVYNQQCTYCVASGLIDECILKNKIGPYCGDGIKNGQEECDKGTNNGVPCSANYENVCVYCDNSCNNVTKKGPYCGDGIKNGQEECDGNDEISSSDTKCSNNCKLIYHANCGSSNMSDFDNTKIKNTPPTSNLCDPANTHESPNVIFSDSGAFAGWWTWDCIHKNKEADPRTASCKAPSCLANPNLIKANTPVMLTRDNDQKTTVRVDCPGPNNNVCCDIHKTPEGNSPTIHVCTGDSDKEIQVQPGINTYPAKCYFKRDCTTDSNCKDDESCDPINKVCIPNDPVSKDITISTMCTNRACNSQGTCQATPKIASDLNQCSSSCSSNADCTRGRIIETRP